MTEPSELSAAAAAARIRAGDLTSEALVRACLDRIAERDAAVRAWAHLDPDRALAEARARDAEEPRGPLHGVPVGVKDLIDTADLPTEYGSPIHAGHRPEADATCVARLRGSGAVVLGKTVTTEFALFHPGPTRNPHDGRRTPGGSSSGSAAAVADRQVPLALGTQTAGSVVRPAGFCGVFGLKPTFDRLPTTGVKAVAPSLDTLGPFARDVDDLALAAGVLAGDARPWPVADVGAAPRVGFARTAEWDAAEPSTRASLEELAGALALPEVELPAAFAGLAEAQRRLMHAEAADALADEWRDHEAELSPVLRALLADGAARTGDERRAALELAERCRLLLDEVLAELDALLVPSVLGEAPVGLDATGDPLFCRAWTLLGTPAVAVPGLRGPAGQPLGVQLVALPGRDDLALGCARWLARSLEERAA